MRARDRWEGSSSDKGLEEAVPGPECEDDMMVNKEIFLHVFKSVWRDPPPLLLTYLLFIVTNCQL